MALQSIIALTVAVPSAWAESLPWTTELERIRKVVRALADILSRLQASELDKLPFESSMVKLGNAPHQGLRRFTLDIMLTLRGNTEDLVAAVLKEGGEGDAWQDPQVISLMRKAGKGACVLEMALSWLDREGSQDLTKPLDACLSAIKELKEDVPGAQDRAITLLLDKVFTKPRPGRTDVRMVELISQSGIPLGLALRQRLGRILGQHVKAGIDPDSFLLALRLMATVLQVPETLEEAARGFPPLTRVTQIKSFVELLAGLGTLLWQSQGLSKAFIQVLSSLDIVRHPTRYDPTRYILSYLDPLGQSVIQRLATALPSSGPYLKSDNGRRVVLKVMVKVVLCLGTCDSLRSAFDLAVAFDSRVEAPETSYINVVASELNANFLTFNPPSLQQREDLCRLLAKWPQHPGCKEALVKQLVNWLHLSNLPTTDAASKEKPMQLVTSLAGQGGLGDILSSVAVTYFTSFTQRLVVNATHRASQNDVDNAGLLASRCLLEAEDILKQV